MHGAFSGRNPTSAGLAPLSCPQNPPFLPLSTASERLASLQALTYASQLAFSPLQSTGNNRAPTLCMSLYHWGKGDFLCIF